MPVWKNASDPQHPSYLFLCAACNEPRAAALEKDGWKMTRPGEPLSCNACSLKCELGRQGLWGADEPTRLAVCAGCAEYEGCFFKGRYYC